MAGFHRPVSARLNAEEVDQGLGAGRVRAAEAPHAAGRPARRGAAHAATDEQRGEQQRAAREAVFHGVILACHRV